MLSPKLKALFSVILSVALLVSFSSPAYPESELERKLREMEEINQAILKYDKLFEQKQKEERQVLGDIRNLEKNINILEGDISQLFNQITALEQSIIVVNQDITETLQKINQRTDYFNERLRNIYQEGNVNYLEVLLKSTSITDFLTRFDLMTTLAENDTRLLQELDSYRREVELKKLALEDQVAQFASLKEQKENKQQQMEIQTRQKSVLLKSIQEQKEEYTKALRELEEVHKQLDAFIKELQSKHPTAYMGSGKMGWPLPGYSRISSPFGYRTHPTLKVRSFHSAIDIPAPKGTPVRASETGRLIFKGYKGAYGNALILDHGGGISTQYSHLNAFADGLGINDLVTKGQVIGYVGSTGWSTGPHLDFIIRVNGEAKNPTLYVKP
jgi:murein DD-endopeptidase MepM/ murein hydrolase activator NlpD